MRWKILRCGVTGHDDRIRCVADRIYLECTECGRETRGWDISLDSEPQSSSAAPGRPLARSLRELWAELARNPFQGAGLRLR